MLTGHSLLHLARTCIHHINKETFLLAFKATLKKVFTPENVLAGFGGAGLVRRNLEAVLSRLDVRLRTSTPLKLDNVAWEARTPLNAGEVEEQSTLIRNRMQIHRGSPTSSVDE